MADTDPGKRLVFGLDRDRLVDSATTCGVVIVILMALAEMESSVLELRILAVVVSFFVLVTLAEYGFHVLTKDRFRR